MNRNISNHFSYAPMSTDAKRSTFDRSTGRTFTFSAGKLYPFYWDEILPGDSIKIDTKAVVRMLTPLFPTMDRAFVDIYWFYRPNRILWDHWKEFMGENTLTAWEQPTEYETPMIVPPTGGWNAKTLPDYLEIKPGVEQPDGINHLPFRMYCHVWNEFFRDQNLKDAAMFNTDETTLTGTNTGDYITNAQLGGAILPVARFKDYFGSRLPAPQKSSSPVYIPSNPLPVFTGSAKDTAIIPRAKSNYSDKALELIQNGNSTTVLRFGKGTTASENNIYNPYTSAESLPTVIGMQATTGYRVAQNIPETNATFSNNYPVPINLWADAGYGIGTINELRTAFAIQRVLERMARGGSRYRELLHNLWNVNIPDSTIQIAEYLGGERFALNVDQVIQQSATDPNGTPLGETGAYSNTFLRTANVNKSFVEHGLIMGLICVRNKSSYQDGIRKKWTRHTKWDYFWPEFSYLGEMPIKNREIFAQGTSTDDETFGFQEAWAEYRYNPSQIMGEMRSNYSQSLDAWHYADDYESLPQLSSGWIDSNAADVIDRSLAIQNNTGDQFLCNIALDITHTRQMPVYSIPGLLDHF